MERVPALYRRTSLDLLMFGYVSGVRAMDESKSTAQAICMFRAEWGMFESDYPLKSACSSYNRMLNEFKKS